MNQVTAFAAAPPPGRLHIDFETRSACDLKKSGVYRYAEDPTTFIWLFSWSLNGKRGRWHYWDGVAGIPATVIDHIKSGGIVVAHNAAFERIIWNVTLRRQVSPDLPILQIWQIDCTMARAQALALPGDLQRLAQIVRAPIGKDMEGAAVMKAMMRPRKGRKGETPDNPLPPPAPKVPKPVDFDKLPRPGQAAPYDDDIPF